MATFQGLLFLVLGLGLVLVVYQSLARGWLPLGPNGLKGRIEISKSDQPALFWLAFMLYAVAGIGLTVFALRLLAGNAVPLPLR